MGIGIGMNSLNARIPNHGSEAKLNATVLVCCTIHLNKFNIKSIFFIF